MPDGAPAFAVLNRRGELVRRIPCINNHYYLPDGLAARLLRSTVFLGHVVATDGAIETADLGPAIFDCVVVSAPKNTPSIYGLGVIAAGCIGRSA